MQVSVGIGRASWKGIISLALLLWKRSFSHQRIEVFMLSVLIKSFAYPKSNRI